MSLTNEISERLMALREGTVSSEPEAMILRGITDCIGVMLAGWQEPVADIARAHAGVSGAAPIFDLGVAAPSAALAYGAAAHALDFDDTGLAGHPSAVLVPAILAEARQTGVDGRSMIAAYLAGYEVWAELWRRDPDQLHAKGWHPTAIFGTLAAAAASAHLRNLSGEATRTALAIAASMAAGVVANFGTMMKPFQVGRAAANGVEASRLAALGLTASPDCLEHPLGFLRAFSPQDAADRDAPISPQFGTHILRYGLNVKLYPVCYALHRAIDGLLAMRTDPRFDPTGIERVEVEIGETQAQMLRHHQPQTRLDAKFSLEFAMAAAAIAGRVGAAELTDAFVQRPDVQAFFRTVEATTIAEADPADPVHSPFDRVAVIMRNGVRLDSGPVTHAEGHFRRPATRDRLREKFIDCAGTYLGEAQAEQLFSTLQTLPALPGIDALAGAVLEPRKAS